MGVSGILQSHGTEDKENNDENEPVDCLHRNDKYVRLFGTSRPTHTTRPKEAQLSPYEDKVRKREDSENTMQEERLRKSTCNEKIGIKGGVNTHHDNF
ncbi:hypothetical protein GUJ93_ZPchr0004g39880 [Zizania palustris]|uniref:Uncharacterized protein n=1 Tax=Zizania palustris TaxID=103762 RepID=A0A8J5VFP3_ZIZPA|nr:hypothetical protein GUJ93_ZPchr0004g39880 [Zizania palustris]